MENDQSESAEGEEAETKKNVRHFSVQVRKRDIEPHFRSTLTQTMSEPTKKVGTFCQTDTEIVARYLYSP